MKRKGLDSAISTVSALRGKDGCPWDKKQNHKSLRRHLLEETYEVLEAIDALPSSPKKSDMSHFQEELGDLLFQVLLHAQIASETKKFNIEDIAAGLSEKLIRRHPHVFGGKKIKTAKEVLIAWEKNKEKEKPKKSVLDGLPKDLPALQKSLKVIEKVSKVGFQWPDLDGPVDKVKEELGEFLTEIKKSKKHFTTAQKKRLENELGDLFFSLSNIAYFLEINPEDALRTMLKRFEKRFRFVESKAKSSGKKLEEMTLKEMDIYWNQAKKILKENL